MEAITCLFKHPNPNKDMRSAGRNKEDLVILKGIIDFSLNEESCKKVVFFLKGFKLITHSGEEYRLSTKILWFNRYKYFYKKRVKLYGFFKKNILNPIKIGPDKKHTIRNCDYRFSLLKNNNFFKGKNLEMTRFSA